LDGLLLNFKAGHLSDDRLYKILEKFEDKKTQPASWVKEGYSFEFD
jgi:hypothetical protein